MKAYYRDRAPVYDRVYQYPERQRDLEFLKAFIPKQFTGRRVLEIAAGTGYWTEFLAREARAVTATDLLPETLARARQRPGVQEVEFVVADAYRLEGVGRGFDGVFAGLWFSHVPIQRRAEFFAVFHRLLTPGALVLLLDNTQTQCQRLPIACSDEYGNTYQDRELDDGTVHRVLKNFPAPEELRAVTRQFSQLQDYVALEHFWVFNYRAR